MLLAKLQAVHAVVGNAPHIVSVVASSAPALPRYFYGAGAPVSSVTLPSSTGSTTRYNAVSGGYVVSAALSTGGTGYAVGDSLAVGACIIIVDAVVGGVVADWHVSVIGDYSGTAYPTSAVAATGGSGSGATFLLNLPAPDFYLDVTSLSSPVLYVCTSAGNAATSVWAKISGGAGGSGWNYRGTYNPTSTYATGDVVFFGSGTSSGLYYSTIDGNTNSPDSGIGWNQLSNGNGTWL